jgi:hypothetical protein
MYLAMVLISANKVSNGHMSQEKWDGEMAHAIIR